MKRISGLFAATCLLAFLAACASSAKSAASPTPPLVGDTCLVGRWTMQQEINNDGFTFYITSAQPAVTVMTGLGGAVLTIGPDGTKTFDLSQSQPLVGMLEGHTYRLTLRGSSAFKISGDGHLFATTGATQPLSVTATLDGVQGSGYNAHAGPASGTYTCSTTSLVFIDTQPRVTDTYQRTG